ncbi:ring-h2 finger protein atl13 [Nicotiana attenuata]|uniref:Ring-h2 finger protein atl13 n=1 Tax=Nicotiana attenuata TaxID=49451 RepID=A0A314L2A5_NICAT|nr:ring-h2 finger protein atl13 [Nicotiana attenuata]
MDAFYSSILIKIINFLAFSQLNSCLSRVDIVFSRLTTFTISAAFSCRYGTTLQNISASPTYWKKGGFQEPQIYAFSVKTVVALRQNPAFITHLEIIQTNCTVHWTIDSLLFGLKIKARKLVYILLRHADTSLHHINVVNSSSKSPQYYTDMNQDKNSDKNK